MRLNISAIAIRHPIPPIILFLLLSIAGTLAVMRLDVTLQPDIDFPTVNVLVARTGAAPSELETQVTRKVEDAVAGLGNVDHIQSTITDGVSYTTVEFALGTNIDRDVNDVRDAVGKIRQQLPQDVVEPQVQRVNIAGDPILYFSLTAPDMTTEQLSWFIDNEVSRAMLAVSGVAQVQRVGGVDREVRVELSPDRLIALGITADAVNNQIRALNLDIPGGRGTVGAAEQSIRTLGSAHTIDELRNTEIALPNGRKARLSDLGRVIDGPAEQRQAARFDGKSVVTFNIRRSPGSSEVTIADGVFKTIADLEKTYPGIRFDKVVSRVDYSLEAYHASTESLVVGAVLAIAVVFWFLRDTRATLIAAFAIPVSVVPTFLVMKALGYTLNFISMLGLSLVIGILVDDAIVEIENIVRHIRMGKKPYLAALEAADEIGLAVVATTMTIVVVFLPVSFMPGVAGQFFRQFGVTVAAAVLFSLLVARLLTPLMAAFLLKGHDEPGPAWWQVRYLNLLRWCLAHRLRTVLAGAGILAVSVALLPFIPSGFMPAMDRGQSVLSLELPPGSTLTETLAVAEAVSAKLQARPEVMHVLVTVGDNSIGNLAPGGVTGTSAGGEVRKATLVINLVPKGERKLSQKNFELAMRPMVQAFAGVRSAFISTGSFSTREVTIILTGDDGPVLARTADTVINEMNALPDLVNVTSSASLERPEVLITPRFDRAAELGVSVQQIGRVAMLATQGDVDQNLAKFKLVDREIPIRVELDPAARGDLATIENLRVMTAAGTAVPLKSVADVTIGGGAVQVDRFDRSRKISIEADLNTGRELGPAMDKVYALPSLTRLPPEVHLSKFGNGEQLEILQHSFGTAMLASILLIFAVLVLLFGNFFQPFTIMMALPLSIGGALLALLMARLSLSMPAMIGMLMLMGIVTKNSILLVEYAIVAIRDHGAQRTDALIDAGRKRARPILMTTVAMIAGMLPTAVGWGAQSDFRMPMAIAVIGGLITSTLLSLIFIPVVFSYVDDAQHWLAPKLRRLLTLDHHHEPAKPPPVAGR